MKRTVYVVDDDAAMRAALAESLELANLEVRLHADGESFLAACVPGERACVILDVAMPGLGGLEVHAAMRERGMDLPVVFLTGHGDVPMAVRAMQEGAVDFIEKPVRARELLERIQRALDLDEDRWRERERLDDAKARCEQLTPREREVMALVVSGLANKEIARKLDLSPRTVEAHRARVMHKLGASNLVELVQIGTECLK